MSSRSTRTAPTLPVLPATAALLVAAIAAVLMGLVAAPSAGAAEAPPGGAWIRAGHFVPGFGRGRVDLTPTNGTQGTAIVMTPNAAYGDVTPYQKILPGSYTVTLRAEGASVSSPALLERAFTVTAGSSSTVAALGSDKAPRLAILADDLSSPPAGHARVRVLSASALVQTLAVNTVGGPTLATGAVLGQTTGYTTVPQGPWTLGLGVGTPLATTRTVTLKAGSVYTAAILDSGASAITLKLLTDASGATSMPAGGAATGGGGMAPTSSSTAPGAPVALVAILVLGLVGVVARMRSGRSAAEGRRAVVVTTRR